MMLQSRRVIFISCCMAFTVMADVEISLSGKVNDDKGSALAGAEVTLVSDASMNAATGAGGEFTISNTTATRSGGICRIPAQTANGIVIRGNQLRFSIVASADNGVVSIFSGSGKRRVTLPLGKMESGVHTHTLPELAPGFYVVHITIDESTTSLKLVHTGNGILMGDNASVATGGLRISRDAAAQGVDTLVFQKEGFETLKTAITSYRQSGITMYMISIKPPVIPVKNLPIIKEMPDPLTMNDGTEVTTPEQWRTRRREMIQILEDYEYGHMPPPPGNVKAAIATPLTRITASGKQADYRMMHLMFGPNEKCGFDLGIFTPVDTVKQYPVLISLGYGAPKQSSLGADENLGLNFRDGSHGMFPEDWSALLDFADRKLLNRPGTRKFDVIPPKEQTP
ncbi:MAG: T9SS type A sorting domain-containing protein [Chitinispirillaceae bacterium]|nr:T9SS type A sorting domain-containing protein [Chitinispirillaceae bacterium]